MSATVTMDSYRACSIAEGFSDEEVDEDLWLEAWQYLINTGLCWRLQGWYGRTARDLIANGQCSEAAQS